MVRISSSTCLVVALLLGLFRPTSAADVVKAPDALAKRVMTDVQPLVTKYCAKCHSGAKPKADLSFDKFRDAQSILAARDAWESVVNNLETQVMPPERSPKP